MTNVVTFLRNMFTGQKGISVHDAYSIAALTAFANCSNESRRVTREQSLEEISNNVVEIFVEVGMMRTRGSGLMFTTDGYVLTAHHVVEDLIGCMGSVKIKTQDGQEQYIKEKSMWYNEKTDIAILKVGKCTVPAPIKIKVSQDGMLQKGDEIRILGFRDGQKYNTLGMITNPHFDYKSTKKIIYDLFQTDARGLQGQSGGIIANGDGELIGIVVFGSIMEGEKISLIGGARISSALRYINHIAAKQSAKMFE
ncbi:MAG: trypsin-like peptidase domain-containing protein [Candidatus Aenigmarchaeota archaeon]|nr:trypsin-like peptidase domain-containing protein [Candidatus Aenigmarchaeota archaeon]